MRERLIKVKTVLKKLLFCIFSPFFLLHVNLVLADTNQTQTLTSFEGHTYEKIEVPMTWSEASNFAQEKSGRLVRINSFQENIFIRSFMSKTATSAKDGGGSNYFWLGGSDLNLEGTWKWSDGERIEPAMITAYNLWANGPGFSTVYGEPDNYTDNQNCLAMGLEFWPKGTNLSNYLGRPGEWNDLSCANKLAFVIEYDTSANFENNVLQVNHLAADGKSYRASFNLTECSTICLKLISADQIDMPSTELSNEFVFGTLKIKKLLHENKVYEVELELIDPTSLLFEVVKSNLTSSIKTFPSTSWITVTPKEANMDSDMLQRAVDYAFNEVITDGQSLPQNTQGLVIVRYGAIVVEKYAANSDRETIATSWSTAKSFTSALVGAALDGGYISSIDLSAANFIEEWKNTENQNVTIKNLLMMSSGLKERGGDDGKIMYSGALKDDGSIDYSRPVNNRVFSIEDREVDPSRAHWKGAFYNWNYQNADTQIVGEIIQRATGKTLYEFAYNELFSKIDMDASWWKDAFNNYMPWCCIDATTRDFARFGLLYAREGKWEQEQVLPGEWTTESTALTTTITSSLPYGYGYFWWPSVSNEWFMAVGSRSNNIYVHPGLDLIAVRNSTLEIVGDTKERSNSYHLTKFPARWDHVEFFQTIIDSVTN